MAYDNGIDYLRGHIEEEKTKLKEFIGLGKCADFYEYRRLCGVIQGLDAALNIVNDLAKLSEETDDND